ncbi:MAG: hypothetical protein WDZ77_00890 [Candidatus Pacearchaeota archaeon]
MIERITLDLDDCVFDSMPHLIGFMNWHFGRNLTMSDVWDFDLAKVYGMKTEDVIEAVREFYDSDFYGNAKSHDGDVEAVMVLKERFGKLPALTSRPIEILDKTWNEINAFYPSCFSQIYFANSSNNNNPGVKKEEYLVSGNYGFFVEDNPEFARRVADLGIKVYMPKKFWNRNFSRHNFITPVNGLKEVAKVFCC